MNEAALPHPLLIADIGGTNARFALVRQPGDPIGPVLRLETGQFTDPQQAFVAAAAHFGVRPAALVCAGAGPRMGRQIALTNAAWVLDIDALAAAFGGSGFLFNDFEALALSLPFLGQEALVPIGAWRPKPAHLRLAIGPGTGLGVAALVESHGRYHPLPSEAAHMGFGPLSRAEERLFRQVERVAGRMTAETLLSGPGLVRLHQARLMLRDCADGLQDAAAITSVALAEPEGDAAETVRLFLALFARFAGDLALAFKAEGGVFIGGGIIPRLLPLLDPQAFRANFEAKAPVEALAAQCATAVITAEAALIGLAAFGAAPERFAL